MCSAGITAERFVDGRSESTRITPAAPIFSAVVLFVGAVSVYDGYLVLRSGDEIRHFEKNPVGLFLIEHNHGNPILFLIVKAIGTCIVLSALALLYRRSQRIAFPVASALMLFQAGLLIFLVRA
jgi:hypothetical protein